MQHLLAECMGGGGIRHLFVECTGGTTFTRECGWVGGGVRHLLVDCRGGGGTTLTRRL